MRLHIFSKTRPLRGPVLSLGTRSAAPRVPLLGGGALGQISSGIEPITPHSLLINKKRIVGAGRDRAGTGAAAEA